MFPPRAGRVNPTPQHLADSRSFIPNILRISGSVIFACETRDKGLPPKGVQVESRPMPDAPLAGRA
jgi:hypothetical protein